jgi:mannose-6-phosphate isomerase-like protein (cupin superfamily)
MDEKILEDLLEIRDYQGQGYQPLVDYGEWRVAMLRYLDAIQPDRVDTMERHLGSDEVFVLLLGKGILFLGGNDPEIAAAAPQVMEPGVIYNIKAGTWHTIVLTRDAKVLLVENRDVDVHNSEYKPLSADLRRMIFDKSVQEKID